MRTWLISLGLAAVAAMPAAAAPWHAITPQDVDLSPQRGVAPDGRADYMVDSELDGVNITSGALPAGYGYRVNVSNLTSSPLDHATLTVEHLYPFFGDPSGYMFLYDMAWNPGGLANGGNLPAYPLGTLAGYGSQTIDIPIILGMGDGIQLAPVYHVVFSVPEPSIFALLGAGGILLAGWAWRKKQR